MFEKTVFKGREIHRKPRKTFAAIAVIIILSFSIPIFSLPSANAHIPSWNIPTYAYIAVSPNPVGINQNVFVIMWIDKTPPTAGGAGGDRWRGYTVTITKPDGNIDRLGPFNSDPTSSTYALYAPNQVGTYKFNFTFPGQVASRNGPTGVPPAPGIESRLYGNYPAGDYVNDTFLPSTATTYLTVQQQQVSPVEEYPLPTEYWTRPIDEENVNWAGITSQWLGGAQLGAFQFTGYNVWQKDGVAPNTPHIMWTRPIEFGGIVGGTSAIPDVGFYSGGSYEGRFANSIIMYGRLYYQEPLGHSNSGGGYTAVDLRTGEVIWHRDDIGTIGGGVAPTFGQLFDYESPNQHGVVGGILWAASASTQYTATTGSTWIAYDAFTGKNLFNLTGVPSGTTVYTDKGEILNYVLKYNMTTKSGWLALWNNTQDNVGLHLAISNGTEAWQWRPNGKSVDMSKAYSWNVTVPSLPGNAAPSIIAILPGDIILGTSSAIAPGVGDRFTPDPYTVWAMSDKPTTRGQLLWSKSYPAPDGNITRRLGPVDPVNRVWTMMEIETMQWLGYNLDNGEPMWGPTTTEMRAYQYYGSGEGGGQRGVVAYGNLYVQGFGGELFAYNTKTGNLIWKFNNTNSGVDTPWGLRPIFIAAIAEGKVYAFNNEHSPNQPLYRGQKIYALDAYTGTEIYSMLGWAGQTGGRGTSTSLLAEGFLVYYNYYDSQIYTVGKGPSKTTVAATPEVVAQGNDVLIKGTVTDQSEGAKDTPAISDANMAQWMEYLYMQKPIPGNATGVPVKLTAIDANGTPVEIGTVTSDMSGQFAYLWTPPSKGVFKIEATFQGTESYWPSYAQTSIGVSTAPSPSTTAPSTNTPGPTTSPTTSPSPAVNPTSGADSTLLVGISAIAIIAIILLTAIVLRRRK